MPNTVQLASGFGEVGRRFKREGTYVYLWLIHVDVGQKPTQFYKAIILQLKTKFKIFLNMETKILLKKKKEISLQTSVKNWMA